MHLGYFKSLNVIALDNSINGILLHKHGLQEEYLFQMTEN